MDEKEQEILLKIGDYLKCLKEESKGSISIRGRISPSGTSYVSYAKSLLKEIIKLKDNFNPEYLDINAIQDLNTYFSKEVAKVEDAHDDAHKEKATQKSKDRLTNCMDNATFHIEMAIPSLKEKVNQTIAEVEANKVELLKQPFSASARKIKEDAESLFAIIYDYGIYYFCKKDTETSTFQKQSFFLSKQDLYLFDASIRLLKKQ